MNGAQDLGGRMGFGPINPEQDEPVFHGEWEKRVLALSLAMGFTGSWNIDISRHARETLHPAFYLNSTYYQIWMAGLERLMLDAGLVEESELAGSPTLKTAGKPIRALMAQNVEAALQKGGPSSRESDAVARYRVGDRVKARNINPKGHTRLPGYCKGKTGIIEACHGPHVFPDSNAQKNGEAPCHLYTVAFTATEIWGDEADANLKVYADLWEPYLDAV